MAWRNQGITGSNNIPLGRRRMGGEEGEDESRTATPPSMPSSSMGPDGPKRGRSPVRGTFLPPSSENLFEKTDFLKPIQLP
jgi:splicing factor 1